MFAHILGHKMDLRHSRRTKCSGLDEDGASLILLKNKYVSTTLT